MKSDIFGGGAKPGGVGGGGTPQSTVVSTRGTPAAGHPARRGFDPVIADVRSQSDLGRNEVAKRDPYATVRPEIPI